MSRVKSNPLNHNTVTRKNLADAYSHLLGVIASKPFLKNEGLNNEVPFHICPFEPVITSDITQLVKQLKNDLQDADVNVLEINLYDLVIEVLQDEGDWEWLLENESTLSRPELKEELQGVLDTETVLMPRIAKKMSEVSHHVMFITGVGEVFPYIRSHNILNNLQRIAKAQPTLMIFPGSYQHSLATGASLVLFGKLTDDKYYRAFNILDRAN
ncbi:DUF1788 domain-containing protein [Shewanella sp. SG41-4]|uniref:DUF1788 domain-containing protein n=1 Tax=Shewanella sp. SG41-4 TaxID=2760976 RepID=UPI0015FF0E0A|nr:DUF1788 domain-containing protein [Shewanella sp. SG41-4]MBB1438393.1 DUF1788 domain-containing protein [Shewanella sp. SG41-4]